MIKNIHENEKNLGVYDQSNKKTPTFYSNILPTENPNLKKIGLSAMPDKSVQYYHCGRCNTRAYPSCVKNHRFQIQAISRSEYKTLIDQFKQKSKFHKSDNLKNDSERIHMQKERLDKRP